MEEGLGTGIGEVYVLSLQLILKYYPIVKYRSK